MTSPAIETSVASKVLATRDSPNHLPERPEPVQEIRLQRIARRRPNAQLMIVAEKPAPAPTDPRREPAPQTPPGDKTPKSGTEQRVAKKQPVKSGSPAVAPTRPQPARKARVIGQRSPAFDKVWDCGDDDMVFLTELWKFLDRAELGDDYDAAVRAIDAQYRRDLSKSGGQASFEEDLRTHFGPGSGCGDIKARRTAERWLRSDRELNKTGWLEVNSDHAPGAEWRVYVNVVPAHAVKVFAGVCKLITGVGLGRFEEHLELPAACKLGSFPIVAGGRDPIVCYLKSADDRNKVINALLSQRRISPHHFADCTVRFTKRVNTASGIGFVKEPPILDGLVDLAHEWSGTAQGAQWLATNSPQFNHDNLLLSFSQMIVALLASAWLDSSSLDEFLEGALLSIFVDLGLDPRTGDLKATSSVVFGLRRHLWS